MPLRIEEYYRHGISGEGIGWRIGEVGWRIGWMKGYVVCMGNEEISIWGYGLLTESARSDQCFFGAGTLCFRVDFLEHFESGKVDRFRACAFEFHEFIIGANSFTLYFSYGERTRSEDRGNRCLDEQDTLEGYEENEEILRSYTSLFYGINILNIFIKKKRYDNRNNRH